MDSILKIKSQHIDLLQKYTSWGKGEQEAKKLLEFLEQDDINWENTKKNSKTNILQTKILVDTNEIASPIHLDYNVELPIVELFINKDNFVIFTTDCIYNCRNTVIEKIKYIDIIGVDENSINDVFRDRPENLQFFDIKLIITNGNRVPIVFEYGISFRPIVYFLTVVNEKKSNF